MRALPSMALPRIRPENSYLTPLTTAPKAMFSPASLLATLAVRPEAASVPSMTWKFCWSAKSNSTGLPSGASFQRQRPAARPGTIQ
ncbi:hypothetical protein D3C83_112230 [compost metagenome]